MPEGSEGQQPSRKEQGSMPEYKQETLLYKDRQLALSITGERGARFDYNVHKYSPTKPEREGIVTTISGNEYYIFSENGETWVINGNESERQGKIVGVHSNNPDTLPPIVFGETWNIPGFYKTTDVSELLLKYKIALADDPDWRKVNNPNPFEKYAKYKSKLTNNS